MDLTLIPFGMRASDGAFVEVAEVPRGRACGCICPSCRTPLIARRGEVNAWHFAHATRATYTSTVDECSYSFFVSVRLMARQILGARWSVRLPEFKASIALPNDVHYPPRRVDYMITDAREVVVEDLAIEAPFGDVTVDVMGRIGDVPFVVYFTHPGRFVPAALHSAAEGHGRCGVLTIALDALPHRFTRHIAETSGPIREVLSRFLAEDLESKAWCFHPRQAVARERALAHAAAVAAAQPKLVALAPVAVVPRQPGGKRVHYECVICKVTWVADAHERKCLKCGETLYTREVADSSGSLP